MVDHKVKRDLVVGRVEVYDLPSFSWKNIVQNAFWRVEAYDLPIEAYDLPRWGYDLPRWGLWSTYFQKLQK